LFREKMLIHPNIHLVSGFISNCYILVGSDGLCLVDCGLPQDFNKILKNLTKLNFPVKPLRQILVTHADGDHFGTAAKLKKITGAVLAASPVEQDAIQKGESSRPIKSRSRYQQFLLNLIRPVFRAAPAIVDNTLAETYRIPLLEGLEVLETPGHTPGHLSFWLPNERILFAGDSIWAKTGHPVASTGANTWDLEIARNSFEKQMQLNPLIICAGHACLFL
jgi:glyoxylase-like metal-dependent hydrolase (beta-lactamase superfamily II)